MDADHRHELKENDLAEFIANFGVWWSKHGHVVVIAVVLIGGGYFVKSWIDAKRAASHEAAWSDLANSTSPQVFREVAELHSDPAVRSLAYLRGADLLLKESTKIDGDLEGNKAIEIGVVNREALEEAVSMYQKVVHDPDARRWRPAGRSWYAGWL